MARHILDARVRDIEKRRLPSKHYVYVIHVSWTDGSITIIYRRYSKFFDFHMKILATFRDEAGAKDPSQRTIPFLPGKKVFGRSHTREVALKRMNQLDEYCRLLVKMPGKISNSEEVINFFSPTPEDINPPNSPDTNRERSSSDIDEISDPIQAEQYRVIADYKKQQKNEVDLIGGDIVEVFEKNENGWWFVSVQDSQGWAPGTFLAKADGNEEEEPLSGNDEKYITNNRYEADQEDELSFGPGVVVNILKKSLDGWWYASHLDKTGWIPATYLQPYKGPDLIHCAPTEAIGNVMSISNLTLTSTPGQSNRFQANPGRGVNRRFNTEAKPTPPRRSTVKKSSKHNIQRAKKKSQYKTTASFEGHPSSEDCVTFEPNQMVEVIHKYEEWWYIGINGKEGWAPASFIEAYNPPDHAVDNTMPPPVPQGPLGGFPRNPHIDPNRGGSNISTDSETGAPRGPESDKYRGPIFGENHGAFKPYRPPVPMPTQFPPKPSNNISDIKKNLRPVSAGITAPKPIPNSLEIGGYKVAPGLGAILESNVANRDNRPAKTDKKNAKLMYRMIATYQDDQGFSFVEGAQVDVLEEHDSGWWRVQVGSQEGWAPSTYLEPLS